MLYLCKFRSDYDIWPHENLNNMFAVSVWCKCFSFLAQLLSLDDETTQLKQQNFDRLASIMSISEEINQRNASMRQPSSFLDLDDTLYQQRWNIGRKQDNPSKSEKYNLFYHSLCNAVVLHCKKNVYIQSCPDLNFPAFRLNAETY